MAFELSNPPRYLEISDPSRTVLSQADIILDHHKYWATAYDASVSEVDPGRHDINAALLASFNQLLSIDPQKLLSENPNARKAQETIREFASSLLATSGLMRKFIEHPNFKVKDPPTDNRWSRTAHLVLDGQDHLTFFHAVPEVHALILPESSSTAQWYKSDNLFVRRVTPAELSSDQQQLQELKDPESRIDPARMATLYPYLGQS